MLCGYITAIELFRISMVSTANGPGAAIKKLEVIVRRSLFNRMGTCATAAMIGSMTTLPGIYDENQQNLAFWQPRRERRGLLKCYICTI